MACIKFQFIFKLIVILRLRHRVLCIKFVIFYTCIYKICFYLNRTNILNIQVPELNYFSLRRCFTA